MKKLGIASVMAAALALTAGAASAGPISVTRDLTLFAPVGQSLVVTFDTANAAGYVWSTAAGIGYTNIVPATDTGSVYSGSYPHFAPQDLWAGNTGLDPTAYGYLTANQHAELTIPSNVSALSVYIGSLDSFNYIGFDSAGIVTWFTGTDLAAISGPSVNGNSLTGPALTGAARYYFDFNGTNVDAVLFASADNSFEIDNIAVPVPEAPVWTLLLLGFGLTGLALRGNRLTKNLAGMAF